MLINWVKILGSLSKNKKAHKLFKVIVTIIGHKYLNNQSYLNRIMGEVKRVQQEITQIHTQKVKVRKQDKEIDQCHEKKVFHYAQNK